MISHKQHRATCLAKFIIPMFLPLALGATIEGYNNTMPGGSLFERETSDNSNMPFSFGEATPGIHTITILNSCEHDIWPAAFGPGDADFGVIADKDHTGFYLSPGSSKDIKVPSNWNGRIWAREECEFGDDGRGSCLVGDCDSKLQCVVSGSPATLAEFNFKGNDNAMFYDISLVDGFNVGVAVMAVADGEVNQGMSPVCNLQNPRICPYDLLMQPPKDHDSTAFPFPDDNIPRHNGRCYSLCAKTGQNKYCCHGKYGTSDYCQHNRYSTACKLACTDAYGYAYNDGSSTFAVPHEKHWDFVVEFCPAAESTSIWEKEMKKEKLVNMPGLINGRPQYKF